LSGGLPSSGANGSSSDLSLPAIIKRKWWLQEEACCKDGLGVLLTDNNNFSKSYLDGQEEKKKSWERYFRQCGAANESMMERADMLKKLIRKGLPDEMRGVLWRFFSGSFNKKAVDSEVDYHALVNDPGKENTPFLDDIEKDLYRSLPEHPFYHTDEGIAALRNVLVTYASFNPDVGYSQSMVSIDGSLPGSTFSSFSIILRISLWQCYSCSCRRKEPFGSCAQSARMWCPRTIITI
jgi:hypothetical protein